MCQVLEISKFICCHGHYALIQTKKKTVDHDSYIQPVDGIPLLFDRQYTQDLHLNTNINCRYCLAALCCKYSRNSSPVAATFAHFCGNSDSSEVYVKGNASLNKEKTDRFSKHLNNRRCTEVYSILLYTGCL